MGLIYLARNQINGKCYLGKTVQTLKARRAQHYSAATRGAMTAFHCALRKYGFEVFDWFVLYDGMDKDNLDRLEIISIKNWNTKAPTGYNLTDGGDGGDEHLEKTKQRMSERHRGKRHSEEVKRKISEAHKGMRLSEETKQKISEAAKGHQRCKGMRHTEEAKQKMSKAQKGRKHSAEARRKMSKARKGRKLSEETKRKIGKANKGKRHSQETKRKISERRKANIRRTK